MILWLDQTACQETALTGGKAANLSRLAADYRVPPGFCLTTTAHAKWSLQQENGAIPQNARELITNAYNALAERCEIAEPKVAVRSSAIGEDGQDASFAGQYDTYLNLVGAEAVIDGIMRCWASASSDRLLTYRRQHGQPTDDFQLAVLVQHLVPADISAVSFSAHPVTNNCEEIVIDSSWGLGESIVSGTVTPDTYTVHKSDFTIRERKIGDKERMTVMTPTGTEEVPIPRPMRKQQVMSDAQIIELAQLAQTLEKQMGWPVDIECAFYEEKLYLLQCRPISTI